MDPTFFTPSLHFSHLHQPSSSFPWTQSTRSFTQGSMVPVWLPSAPVNDLMKNFANLFFGHASISPPPFPTPLGKKGNPLERFQAAWLKPTKNLSPLLLVEDSLAEEYLWNSLNITPTLHEPILAMSHLLDWERPFSLRFGSKEDIDRFLSSSPISIASKKLHLIPWFLGQERMDWPSLSSVWI